MSEPRDHHFVPKFFLKSWCDEKGQVIEYAKRNGKHVSKSVGPGSTGFQRDAYAFPELPPGQAQFLEKVYFDFHDRTASAAHKELLLGALPSSNDGRSAWTRFVMGLHMRHPDGVPELRAAARTVWDGSGEKSEAKYQEMRGPEDPPTFDAYIAERDPYIVAKAELNLMIKACFENPALLQRVHTMTWAVLDLSRAKRHLLLSDRPVALFLIGKPDGYLWLPISPTRLFVAAQAAPTINGLFRKKQADIISIVNKATVTRARRFVWASDCSQEHFVERYFGAALDPLPLFPNAGALRG